VERDFDAENQRFILSDFSMKTYISFLLAVLALTLSGCDVIGGIFEAGVWSGIIVVVLVVGLLLWLVGKVFRR
jgi:cytosine/uracil/thiamine/allantoin permease